MDEKIFSRAKQMLTLNQKVDKDKIIASIKTFIPKAKIIWVGSRQGGRALDRALDLDLDRARARALDPRLLSWLSLDCHNEALCVLSDDQKIKEKWMPFFEACEYGLNSLYLADDKTVYLIPNPDKILTDGDGRFHADAQSAISWLEGEMYYWHGVNMPARAIIDIESYTASEILAEHNTEVRRALMSLYGWDRILPEVNAKIIDQHPDPTIGKLYEFMVEREKYHIVIAQEHRKGDLFPNRTYAIATRTSLNKVVASLKDTYPLYRRLSDEQYLSIPRV